MQVFLRVQKWTLFAPSVCDFVFELPCTSVESHARLLLKTSTSIFTRYRYHVPGIHSKYQFAAGTPIVLLYEKGDAVRIEPRRPSPNTCAASARAARGRRLQAFASTTVLAWPPAKHPCSIYK